VASRILIRFKNFRFGPRRAASVKTNSAEDKAELRRFLVAAVKAPGLSAALWISVTARKAATDSL
jgi:hypothetical protein